MEPSCGLSRNRLREFPHVLNSSKVNEVRAEKIEHAHQALFRVAETILVNGLKFSNGSV